MHAHGVAVSRQKGGESAGAFAAATASGEVPEIPAEELSRHTIRHPSESPQPPSSAT